MLWFLVLQVISMLVELVRLGRKSENVKDLEIVLLRRQLAMYERRQDHAPRLSRSEKLTLEVLATKLKVKTRRTINAMGDVVRIVRPATLFAWHRQLVRRRWTYQKQKQGGRPRIDREIEALVVRLARENEWGVERIEGELLMLGYTISHETVAHILRRQSIPSAPDQESSPSWRQLMTHYKEQLVACDFFTVESLFLQTLHVLVFIEIGSRRVHFAGCTSHPDSAWVTQQARQVLLALEDHEPGTRFLIHDNDKKFSQAFDTVLHSAGAHVIHTPYRAPNANAVAERWIRSARKECLNKLLIINQAHLQRVMRAYVAYFNTARPHQGLDQQIPVPTTGCRPDGPVRRRDAIGGIIHDYFRDAA